MNSPASRLIVLDEATLQIADQALYYQEKVSLELALRWESAVEAAIGSLRTFPERGAKLETESRWVGQLRKLHIHGFPKHLILYRFDPESKTVLIACILHGARDIDSFLHLNLRDWPDIVG